MLEKAELNLLETGGERGGGILKEGGFFTIIFVCTLAQLLCSSRKYPYPPKGQSLQISTSRGTSKAKFLRESMKQIPGEGVQTKNYPWGGMDNFWNYTSHTVYVYCNQMVSVREGT